MEGDAAEPRAHRAARLAHYHCPHDCEHPQPFVCDDGRRLCGRCYFVDGIETEVILCTEDICEESSEAQDAAAVDAVEAHARARAGSP